MTQLEIEIKNGNRAAFQLFFNNTYNRTTAFLTHAMYNSSYADDIAQEAFVKLWVNRQMIDPAQSLDAWFFTIVRNTMISHLRKMVAEKKKGSTTQLLLQEAETEIYGYTTNDGLHHLQQQDIRQLFNEVLQSIDPVKERCFRLHREQGLTYREIAQSEKLSVKTVERYISDTLKLLKLKFPVTAILIWLLFV
ncbi:hypothetical protein A4D02_32805 [Niastella koreensis]|uniref:RNA polymerase, sigma-24 subunit, ECF subfamily n=2 Tax=Niastella koreensis TaxID=354356 RepID=G8T7G9_NIAKG|nr:RNA polymerase sigma factor [Niastella koreensis]AEW01205.1 RNA polymerase, sigma-24 subunit, ECF subfamily [Niastella koreensis GR20-10]OQP45973.1 hypothetical protein A4D02_32805 [Niastella koreensis]